jgi:ribose transport system ATP-binding protein
MPVPVLALRSIRRRFSPDFALEDLCLDLFPGEIHGIVGENGSGKSALMKTVSGTYRPESGELFLEGRAVRFAAEHEARVAGISYQHQDPQLWANLSVAENVFFGRMPKRGPFRRTLDPYKLHSECLDLFARLKIDINPETHVSALGYTQRLLIAATRACVVEAKVLILDEPTAGMGEAEREIIFGMVRELKSKGAGIFYITHKLDEIGKLCDRVTVIHQGRVAGSMASVDAERETIIRMMTGRIHAERYPRLKVEAGKVVLAVEGLRYGEVLKDVSFSLREGEILGITGLMGSGRTKLANCIFGQERPTGGTISLRGTKVRFDHPSQALREGIALVPEDRDSNALFHQQDLIRNMTAAALSRFREAGFLDTEYMRALTDEYIRSLNILPGYTDDLIRQYSGGNQQKVIVARWLMSLCKIFIMDEPTRGVDAAARVDIYGAMNDLVTKGASIILISSDIEEILGMCDRILVLAAGRISREFSRREATKEKVIDSAL